MPLLLNDVTGVGRDERGGSIIPGKNFGKKIKVCMGQG